MDDYSPGFEEDERQRSEFIRQLTLRQLGCDTGVAPNAQRPAGDETIPRTLVRFWHDPDDVPSDVRRCMDSWEELRDQGLSFRMLGDASAAEYIAEHYGPRELAAFARCRHPAMRSDYLRLCFLLADGGLYVDADDVLVGTGWRDVFRGGSLKVQPLCYDLVAQGMVPASEIRRPDLSASRHIFYVNNNPIAAPPGHPVVQRALLRATDRLLGGELEPEIQSTTGPGNLSAALAAHARESRILDYELLLNWETTAEPCWELEYRSDDRNWRNMDRR